MTSGDTADVSVTEQFDLENVGITVGILSLVGVEPEIGDAWWCCNCTPNNATYVGELGICIDQIVDELRLAMLSYALERDLATVDVSVRLSRASIY